jgi:hypothetical protein
MGASPQIANRLHRIGLTDKWKPSNEKKVHMDLGATHHPTHRQLTNRCPSGIAWLQTDFSCDSMHAATLLEQLNICFGDI